MISKSSSAPARPHLTQIAANHGTPFAFLTAGFETGRDVLVATLANKGNAPVHPHPIDLIQRDPVADAAAVADALLRYLETGVPAGTIDLKLEYVATHSAQ